MELEEARETKRTIREAFDEKKRLMTENASNFFKLLLETPHKARVVWSQTMGAIHDAARDQPFKTRNVTVFTAKKTQRGPTKQDVRAAAKLLRHPALGWDVRFSSSRDGNEFRIIYRHRSVIED